MVGDLAKGPLLGFFLCNAVTEIKGGSFACTHQSQKRYKKRFVAKKVKGFFKEIAPSPKSQVS